MRWPAFGSTCGAPALERESDHYQRSVGTGDGTSSTTRLCRRPDVP